MRTLVAALLVALPAAPAQASYVGVRDGVLIVYDSDGEIGNGVRVSVAADGRHQIVDSAGVQAYEGCEQVDGLTALCAPQERILALFREGADLFAADPSITAPVEFRGGPGDDRARGGSGADTMDGEDGNDQLDGGAGNDRLEGYGDDDRLLGGDGEDLVDGGSGFDDLDGGLGRDVIKGGFERDRLRHRNRTAGVRVIIRSQRELPPGEDLVEDVEVVEGTPFDDVIQGGVYNDEIDAGEGDDRVSGGGGSDVLVGGPGADLLYGDADDVDAPTALPSAWGGRDDLRGGPGDDGLRGDGGRDRLAGEEGDDLVDAREGTSTQEVLDEEPSCGAGADRAVLDWNDEPADCEALEVRPRPPFPRPQPTGPDPAGVPGPGPQPVLGAPRAGAGAIRVPVFCPAATTCAARVTVRAVRAVRIGDRRRSRAGRALVTRRARVAAGATDEVVLRLPSRARRGRVIVELRIGRERWARPLRLSARALGS